MPSTRLDLISFIQASLGEARKTALTEHQAYAKTEENCHGQGLAEGGPGAANACYGGFLVRFDLGTKLARCSSCSIGTQLAAHNSSLIAPDGMCAQPTPQKGV